MYNAVQSTDYKRIVSIPMDFWLYISGIVLHIKCIFSQWMQALPQEREQVLLLWRRSVVRPFVQ
jgi:hypothetical protein